MMTSTELEQHPLAKEIQAEVISRKVFFYGKGTRFEPRCGFTLKVIQLLDTLGVDYELQDILQNPEKRLFLNEYLEWPTVPKIFVNGEFIGGCDIFLEMAQNGELQTLLAQPFEPTPVQ